MVKVLADGKKKITMLTRENAPENPAKPTATELNGGKDISCDVVDNDFSWTNTDSDAITDQKPVCAKGNTTTYGASNYDLGMTLFRYFGQEVDEAAWEELSEKANEVHIYVRETDKDSEEEWEEGDEIYLGGRISPDSPQRLDGEGFIRRRIPMGAQQMYENIVVAEGGGGSGE